MIQGRQAQSQAGRPAWQRPLCGSGFRVMEDVPIVVHNLEAWLKLGDAFQGSPCVKALDE